MSEEERRLSRRELLKKAGAGAAAVGAAGVGAPFAFAGPHKYTGRWLSGNLNAITWVHFVPSYDAWLDPWAKAWGEANDVQVTIDHINNTLLDTRAAADCPKMDAWRQSLRIPPVGTRPAPQQDCAPTFGNSDIFGFTTSP